MTTHDLTVALAKWLEEAGITDEELERIIHDAKEEARKEIAKIKGADDMGSNVKFTIPLQPKPKQRPQHGKGYTFTPEETREYEAVVGFYARRAIKQPLTGAISVKMDFYMPIPKSWSKAKKESAADGFIRPASKPDIDNLTKAILDGMNNGIAYNDDSQIVELSVREWYGEPGTEIELEELC